MEIASETERKYDVPEAFELPSLAGIAGISTTDGAQTHDLDATYFDTEELTLMRHRRTLRRRTGGSDAGWHLKTPGEGTSRKEHRVPLNGDGDGDGDDVPGELKGQVRALIRRRPLKPIARLRTHRVETPLCDADGTTLALLAQDRVTAETDGREQHWQEIEVELVDGDPAVLAAVEERLLSAGARPASGPSKVSRALGDPAPQKTPKTKKKIQPVLAYVREQRFALAAYDPGVRQGGEEAVHKMRVATRRLRSTLKTFKRTYPGTDEVRQDLKWLADLLGAVRDGQVQRGKLLAGVRDAGPEFTPAADRIEQHLADQVEGGRQALGEALESERYLALLDRVDQLADDLDAAEDDPMGRARKTLAKADGLLDQALADSADAELHEARKKYKQARYAVEVFQPAAGRTGKKLVDALTDLQDVLGAHQDSVVARELLHELGPDSFWFGVLWARQEEVGRDTYAELPLVVEKSRRKKLRKWLG
jgi:CHAD domain-containing protein